MFHRVASLSNDAIKLMDDTLNDGDNGGSEFEHGDVEEDDDKIFYAMNRILELIKNKDSLVFFC